MGIYESFGQAISDVVAAATADDKPKGVLAYVGFTAAGGTYATIVDDDTKWLWVRIVEGAERGVDQAFNEARVLPIPDLPVRVVPFGGHHKIVGYDVNSLSFLKNLSLNSHEPGVGDPDPITDRRIQPGLVHAYKDPSTGYGLVVTMEAFSYTWGGVDQYWPGGTVDLTSYLPAANQHVWVKIGLDPSTNLPVVVVGTAQPVTAYLGRADLDVISFADYIPQAGVILAGGQTQIASESAFVSCRPWWTGAGAATGGELVDPEEGTWSVDLPPDYPSGLDDEFDDASFDTGLWTEYDPGGKQAVGEAGTTLTLEQATQSAVYTTGVYQAVPAGDFTLAVKLKLSHDLTDADGERIAAGFGLWEDAADQSKPILLVGLGAQNNAAANEAVYSGKGFILATDYDSWSSSSFAGNIDADTWYYLRLRRDGSLYYLDRSNDGLIWSEWDITSPVGNLAAVGHFGLAIANKDLGADFTGTFEFCRYRAVADSLEDPVYGAYTGSRYLNDLVDVDTATDPPTDTQSLVWDATGGVWVPGTPPIPLATDNVSNPPTDAELDAAFGTPAAVGAGFARVLDDGGDDTTVYLVTSNGTSWWFVAMTKAT